MLIACIRVPLATVASGFKPNRVMILAVLVRYQQNSNPTYNEPHIFLNFHLHTLEVLTRLIKIKQTHSCENDSFFLISTIRMILGKGIKVIALNF